MAALQSGQLFFCILLLSLVLAAESTFFRMLHLHHMQPKSPCKPNCCAHKKCAPASHAHCKPNQMRKPHAGWCGCCPKCMTQLKEGDHCQPKPKHPQPNMPSAECGCGMKCVNKKCCK